MNNVRSVFNYITQVVTQFTIRNFNHYIARIIVAFPHYFFTVLHFIYFLHGQKHLLYGFAPATARHFFIEVFFYLPFLATHHAQYIPFGIILLYLFGILLGYYVFHYLLN